MPFDPTKPVLVVDDSLVMAKILGGMLAEIGVTDIETALGVGEALERLERRDFGLVISDWHMPPLTGGDLVRAMRERPGLAGIPVVLATARSSPGPGAEGIPVETIAVKPFTAQKLRERIEAACA
jgi:two-component system chemotaxis response regulator CheY